MATVVPLNACCNICLPGRNTLVPRSGATSCNSSMVKALQCNGHCCSLRADQRESAVSLQRFKSSIFVSVFQRCISVQLHNWVYGLFAGLAVVQSFGSLACLL